MLCRSVTNECILCRRRDLSRSIGASADPQPSGRSRTHRIELLAEDSVISAVRVSRHQTSSGGSPRQQSAQSTVNSSVIFDVGTEPKTSNKTAYQCATVSCRNMYSSLVVPSTVLSFHDSYLSIE